MTLEVIGISVLWIFLFGYVIIASVDFGAGFFNAYSTLTGQQHIFNQGHSTLSIACLGGY
ncbi:hypothetical protein GCM10020331_097580 [Ectobacillus funiculus]